MRPLVPPLGATMTTTTTTAAMLGGVVAAVAGAALAPVVLPLAHAAAGEPGTLAFEAGVLYEQWKNDYEDPGVLFYVRDVAVGPDGHIFVANGFTNINVFHPNGTSAYLVPEERRARIMAVGPDGSIVTSGRVYHPNGTTNFFLGVRGAYTYDVAVGPDGRIVKGSSDSRIRVYHPNGTLDFTFGELGEDVGEFGRSGVGAVAVGPGGFIAAVDAGSSAVLVFYPNGTFAGEFEHGLNRAITDIAFGPSGEAALASRNGTFVFYSNGTSAFNVTSSYRVDIGPTGMVVGPTGLVHGVAVDGNVAVFNGIGPADEWQPPLLPRPPPATSPPGAAMPYAPPVRGLSLAGGTLAFEFGSYGQGPGEFLAPYNIAFGPGGVIAVSDVTNHRIQLFHPNGTFAFEFGSYGQGPGEFLAPYNIAFGPGGVIAVSDVTNHRIQLFHPNGTFAFELGSRGSGLGEFVGPYGLAFGPNGLLAVSDVGNHRVQVFRVQ